MTSTDAGEPVTWRYRPTDGTEWFYFDTRKACSSSWIEEPLYPAPALTTQEDEIKRLRKAAVSALTSMLIASKLPGVSDEYDFEPVIQEISAAINTMPRATLDAPKGDGR